MKKGLLITATGSALAILLPSCIDETYDLSDIDTTSRINVNNLVIPVNLDKITLDDIISLDDNSKISAVTINGETFYALTENGDFSSDQIEIEKVNAGKPVMSPSTETLSRVSNPAFKSHRAPSSKAVSYHIKEMGEPFTYTASSIDKAIVDITSAQVDNLIFEINLKSLNLSSSIEHTYLSNVTLLLPKGLTGKPSLGSYDPSTGIWLIPEADSAGDNYSFTFTCSEIDLKANDCSINPSSRDFNLSSQFKVTGGIVTLEPKANVSLPQNITFQSSYNLSDLNISAISGIIDYQLDGMDIAPIQLSDIPDFLSSDGTNLLLSNPQIYISLNNPIANYNLDYSTGLTLTAIRQDAPDEIRSISYSIDNGPISIGHSNGNAGPYQFVLTPPQAALTIPEEYDASLLNRTSFSGLSDILSVPESFSDYSKFPDQIDITLNNPCVPRQNVKNFRLGHKIPGITGKYSLIAPLNLKKGSVIIYSDTENGWNDEDVDAITIEHLSLTAIADNDTPLNAEIVAYPLDINGNKIPNVKVTSNILQANTTGAPIEIKLEGKIEHLDGVVFEARVHPGENDSPLAPSQTIKLNNIRAKVSGYYTKKF